MPTPVCTARQCLTDEAARALDDAVCVARRRNHAQTTSLHVVSAFLSTPSSLLREACTRARSSAYAPRLQFRALDFSVGVALDRMPCSKNQDEAPPISNSLMAAIKRSQANQRRQPEMYHISQLQYQNVNSMSITAIKVELNQFVLSILDDPIVNRVFGEAGFRTCDIKLAIVHPPVQSPARYLRARCPPLFLSNLMDSGNPVRRNFPFPFAGVGNSNGDAYCKRIGEVLVKKSERNPLLVGGGAKDALTSFKECVEKGKSAELLPGEILGLNFVCLEKDIAEFLANGGDEEAMNSKAEELRIMVEKNSGPGVVVNFGELEVLVDDSVSADAVKCLVLKLSSLVELYKKLRLIGVAANYETYRKLIERFPSIESDWDLQPLPITSTIPSLMGSFVPFGGFFSGPSEFRNPIRVVDQPFSPCNICNEKYERELSSIMKRGSSASIVDQCTATLPSWLQMAESDSTNAGIEVNQAKVDIAESNVKILGLQKKWNDICQHLHQSPTISKPGISLARPEVSRALGFQFADENHSKASEDMDLNKRVCSGFTSCVPFTEQNISSQKQDVASPANNQDSLSKLALETSKSLIHERDSSTSHTSRLQTLGLSCDPASCSSSVAIDLGLGALSAYKSKELQGFCSHDKGESLQHLSDSISIEQVSAKDKTTSNQIGQSPRSPSPDSSEIFDPLDYKLLYRNLTEIVGWQHEAICSASQILSKGRSRKGPRPDIWMSFIGPDKMGKRRTAEALADVIFGSRENLISVDLSCQEKISDPNSIFHHPSPRDFDKVSRNTAVGYIAEELSKKPRSIVFLENVDQADLLVQSSLSRAIQTGKFPDSHGREISIINTIFVISSMVNDGMNLPCGDKFVKFSEQMISEAKNWQMQIVTGCADGDATKCNSSSVSLPSENGSSHRASVKRRKISQVTEPNEHSAKQCSKIPKNLFDLNLPLEESEEATEMESSDSSSISSNSRAWLDDFLGQVDGKVVFRPFDFDTLADQLMKKISLIFQKKLGPGIRLEINHEVIMQILAAAWSSSKKGAIEDWIEHVLGLSFAEAQQRYRLTTESFVKLVACEGLSVTEQAPGICLPNRINFS